jgi:hypothetical protein
MGTTTNNGWPTPVATDLVKDGWEAIKDLGDAIDTTLGVYAPSTPGLTLINTTSFSGVSSQSLNDVFSTTYDNYKLVFKLTSTTETRVDFRLRVSGADNSTSNYYKESNIAKDTAVAGAESLAQDRFVGFGTNTSVTPIILEVFSPFISEATAFLGWNHKVETLASVHENNFSSGLHNVASSFTGITFFGPTMTGTVSVYGYNK